MAFISVLLQIFWKKFYRNVSGVFLYQPYEFCPNQWFWLVAMATERLNFWKKYSKIFSEAQDKLNLCINVHDISLYINYIFYCCCPCAFIAISVLLQIFWQKFYRNVSGVVLYQPYEFCPNHWFWLVAMATERLNFLACNIYSILAEYSLHSCTFRWVLWPMGLWC